MSLQAPIISLWAKVGPYENSAVCAVIYAMSTKYHNEGISRGSTLVLSIIYSLDID